MGRKLDLGNLTKEEKTKILQVIQRDFDLRKIESERVGKLNKDLSVKSEKESDPTICVICGSTFMWLFNPKMLCSACNNFFCKSKQSCGGQELNTELWICHDCYKRKEAMLKSFDWFYSQLKNKFRRHGGAKILREFYKRKKSVESAPEKPPRVTSSITKENLPTVVEEGIQKNEYIQDDEEENNAENEQDEDDKDQTKIRIQIEKVIASVLLPKIEELKAAQQQSRDPEYSLGMIEQMMDKFLSQVAQRQQHSRDAGDDDLMWRYLKDHKQSVMLRIMQELTEQNQLSNADDNSVRSSVKNAETMTEASDSELDSSPSCSGSLRSRSSFKAPLSERMRNLSPESLRSVLNSPRIVSGSTQNVVQGVIHKDEMIAMADVDSALSEILDVSDTRDDQLQEFSTELTFTAVGVNTNSLELSSSRKSSNSDEDQTAYLSSDNWTISSIPRKSPIFKTSQKTYLPETDDSLSAYKDLDSNSEKEDDAIVDFTEDKILPLHVKKDFSEISARTLASDEIEINDAEQPKTRRPVLEFVGGEIVESLSQQLHSEQIVEEKTNKPSKPPVEEDLVIPVYRDVRESFHQVLTLKSAITAFQTPKIKSQNSSHSHRFIEQDENELLGNDKLAKENSTISEKSTDSERNSLEVKQCNITHTAKRPTTTQDEGDSILDEKLVEHLQAKSSRAVHSPLQFDSGSPSDDDVSDLSIGDVSGNESDTFSFFEDSSTSEHISDKKQKSDDPPQELKAEPIIKDSEIQVDSVPLALDLNKQEGIPGSKKSKFTISSPKINENHFENALLSSATDRKISLTSSSDSSDAENEKNTQLKNYNNTERMESCNREADMQQEIFEQNARRTIDEIVRDLQNAGLEAKKTKFKRSSLDSSPRLSKQLPSNKSQPRLNPTSVPTAHQEDEEVYVYTYKVDPENFKKTHKLERTLSPLSSLLSDTESVKSYDTPSVNKYPSHSKRNSCGGSVAKRRSQFENSSENSLLSPRSSLNHRGSTASSRVIKYDSDSDVSSVAIDKLEYEADTSVTSDREVGSSEIVSEMLIIENSATVHNLDPSFADSSSTSQVAAVSNEVSKSTFEKQDDLNDSDEGHVRRIAKAHVESWKSNDDKSSTSSSDQDDSFRDRETSSHEYVNSERIEEFDRPNDTRRSDDLEKSVKENEEAHPHEVSDIKAMSFSLNTELMQVENEKELNNNIQLDITETPVDQLGAVDNIIDQTESSHKPLSQIIAANLVIKENPVDDSLTLSDAHNYLHGMNNTRSYESSDMNSDSDGSDHKELPDIAIDKGKTHSFSDENSTETRKHDISLETKITNDSMQLPQDRKICDERNRKIDENPPSARHDRKQAFKTKHNGFSSSLDDVSLTSQSDLTQSLEISDSDVSLTSCDSMQSKNSRNKQSNRSTELKKQLKNQSAVSTGAFDELAFVRGFIVKEKSPIKENGKSRAVTKTNPLAQNVQLGSQNDKDVAIKSKAEKPTEKVSSPKIAAPTASTNKPTPSYQDFNRNLPIRGSLTMRGSCVSPKSSNKPKTRKSVDKKARTPFVIEL